MSKNENIIDAGEADFNDKVIEASSSKLVVVDFWAPWCGPCKQLTPILEKVANSSADKFTLVKINIDENQQIAAQLRIQSIPTVFAFKDKQIVNAFQGVLPEKQVIEFIEKCLGSKIKEDFSDFYQKINDLNVAKKFEEVGNILLEFISNNPSEVKAIGLYLDCLIEMKKLDEAEEFIESLEKEIQDKDEINQIIKKINIIKNNISGPSIETLLDKLKEKPENISLVLEIADKYFSSQNYDDSFNLLLKYYPKNKEPIKKKMVELFEVLGHTNDYTITYRKKLSQIMFS